MLSGLSFFFTDVVIISNWLHSTKVFSSKGIKPQQERGRVPPFQRNWTRGADSIIADSANSRALLSYSSFCVCMCVCLCVSACEWNSGFYVCVCDRDSSSVLIFFSVRTIDCLTECQKLWFVAPPSLFSVCINTHIAPHSTLKRHGIGKTCRYTWKIRFVFVCMHVCVCMYVCKHTHTQMLACPHSHSHTNADVYGKRIGLTLS
jgi:hypothetical protein